MEEQLLIAGCQRGESWAYKKLYELHAPVMMSVCMRYVNDRETAQDILQEGFIKVFTKFHTYSGIGSVGGWMRRIFVTTALEYLRQNDALRLSVSLDVYNDTMENYDVSVLDQLSADEIMGCIAKLPEGYRTIFNLFAIEGYTHSEIAEMLNIKESTSRSQFLRGRKVLQDIVLSSLMVHEDAKQGQG